MYRLVAPEPSVGGVELTFPLTGEVDGWLRKVAGDISTALLERDVLVDDVVMVLSYSTEGDQGGTLLVYTDHTRTITALGMVTLAHSFLLDDGNGE